MIKLVRGTDYPLTIRRDELEDLIKACIYFSMFEKKEVGTLLGTKDKLLQLLQEYPMMGYYAIDEVKLS